MPSAEPGPISGSGYMVTRARNLLAWQRSRDSRDRTAESSPSSLFPAGPGIFLRPFTNCFPWLRMLMTGVPGAADSLMSVVLTS